MAVFKFSLEPWVDDRGQKRQFACVGRDIDGNAAIVDLHHDCETDMYLYSYWSNGIFAKVFVTEVRSTPDPDPIWEIRVGGFRYEPPRPEAPSVSEQSQCIAQIVDALSQCPESDLSKATPGAILRRIEVKHGWP